MKETKMIRIVSRGYVSTARGRIMTPIISPYRESINRIWNMITVDRADVEEKLPDGTFVRLTVQNYDKDNTIKPDVATGVPSQVVKPIVKDTVPPVVNNNTPEEKKETVKAEEPKTEIPVETESSPEPVEEHKDEVPAEGEEELTETEDAIDEDESDEEEEGADDAEETPANNQPGNNSSRKRNRKHRNRQNTPNNGSLSVNVEEVK